MILFLAGTSDARQLALLLKENGYQLLTTVVTENAAKSLRKCNLSVHVGRLTSDDMVDLIKEKKARLIVDASHPFAEEASKNATEAAEKANVPYIRYERESQTFEHEKVITVKDYREAAEVAKTKKGAVMLTTGSKTLEIFMEVLHDCEDVEVVARMLPRKDNMEKCVRLGVKQKNIIAMQGPFSKALNKALYDHYNVTLMVTKESGKVGAVDEKLTAALEMGIETVVIKRPKINYDKQFSNFTDILQAVKRNY